jgi:hypothetical protein
LSASDELPRDLSGVIPRSGVTITTPIPEDPAQRDHRIRQEAADNRVRRAKDLTTFYVSWLAIVAIAGGAAIVAFDQNPTRPDLASWGRTILGTLLGAIAGYVVRGKTS